MVESCAPVALHYYERNFPFPLVGQIEIEWSFSLDATKSEPLTGPNAGTLTTTLSGSGSGNLVIVCEPTRFIGNRGAENFIAEKFIVTRKLSSDPLEANFASKFTLWCSKSAAHGTYSIETVVETDYDDPLLSDSTVTTTDEGEAAILPIIMKIGLTEASVDQFFVGSATAEAAISFWLPADGWTFDRSGLFSPQSFSETKTAEELGYESGAGWEQSVTVTAMPWPPPL